MAHPATAQVEHAANLRQAARVVFFQQRDGVVVDVRDEAGGGVEGWVGGFVGADEGGGGVREGEGGGRGGVGGCGEGRGGGGGGGG